MSEFFQEIVALCENDQGAQAMGLVHDKLYDDPKDNAAWMAFGYTLLRGDQPAFASRIFSELTRINPDSPAAWNNLGKALTDIRKHEEADKAYERAWEIHKDLTFLINRSTNYVQWAKPEKAIELIKEIERYELTDTQLGQIRTNSGFARLSLYDWNGWSDYEFGLGHIKCRDERNYVGEPRWDGRKGQSIVVYGEQGLGEQICWAQSLTEARRDCKHIYLDVHPKLSGLFARSFTLPTYGTLNEKSLDWPFELEIDASIVMASLQKFYRYESGLFTGKPYLIPCPIRRKQWRATINGLPGKPAIGIAWSGGTDRGFSAERSLSLYDLLPVFQAVDANWVCLEYKDRYHEIQAFTKETGIVIHDWPWGTQTKDYDDTAALVSELDMVVSVPTTVFHLAGALGVPAWVITNPKPHFLLGVEGEESPWYESVRYYRDGIERLAKDLRFFYETRDYHSGWTGSRRIIQAGGEFGGDCPQICTPV